MADSNPKNAGADTLLVELNYGKPPHGRMLIEREKDPAVFATFDEMRTQPKRNLFSGFFSAPGKTNYPRPAGGFDLPALCAGHRHAEQENRTCLDPSGGEVAKGCAERSAGEFGLAQQQMAEALVVGDVEHLAREVHTVAPFSETRPWQLLVDLRRKPRIRAGTVDNLPRETAPVRVMPLEPVPGRFTPGPQNAARYAPYVSVLEALDSGALVQRYIDSYPLFQQAYEDLGYPKAYFNDRLIEVIDHLLAAPEMPAEAKLVQPKVFYQFADPDLEKRSAGQKIMMRIGNENAAVLPDGTRLYEGPWKVAREDDDRHFVIVEPQDSKTLVYWAAQK